MENCVKIYCFAWRCVCYQVIMCLNNCFMLWLIFRSTQQSFEWKLFRPPFLLASVVNFRNSVLFCCINEDIRENQAKPIDAETDRQKHRALASQKIDCTITFIIMNTPNTSVRSTQDVQSTQSAAVRWLCKALPHSTLIFTVLNLCHCFTLIKQRRYSFLWIT